jgi:hypothetical protein
MRCTSIWTCGRRSRANWSASSGAARALPRSPFRCAKTASRPRSSPKADLLDATPLDADERRELADLQRLLKDRIPRTAAMKARASGASSFACAAFGRGSCATSWPG